MRNFIAIFLFSIYSLSMLGLIVNVHFCQGEAESIGVVSEVECCCIDESGIMDNCCEDKTVTLQMDEQVKHLKLATNYNLLVSWEALPKLITENIISSKDSKRESKLYLDLPPPKELNFIIQTQKLILYS